MLRTTQILLWRVLAITALALGLVGVAAPVLPTAPFLIVAAWAGGKGWPALEEHLLNHPLWGPHIRTWREHRAIPRKAKWGSSLMMLGSSIGLQFTDLPLWLRLGAPLCLLLAAVWIWRLPDAPTSALK